MTRVLACAALAAVVAAVLPAATAAGAPRVTVIGDSVAESLEYSSAARAILGRGLDLRLETAACRKLTAGGCIGGSPESALSLVRRRGAALGRVVVVSVGYNDGYGAYGVAEVMAAARSAGVRRVVWVTLPERQSTYRAINDEIRRAAARRGSRIRLADWGAASAGRPWFGGDGVHLSGAGAEGLAGFLHRHVVAALAEVGTPVAGAALPVIATARRAPHAVAGIAGDDRALWVHGGRTLSALVDRTGRRRGAAPLARSDTLVADAGGRGLWIQAGGGDLARAAPAAGDLRGRSAGRFAAGAVAVRAPAATWIAGRHLPVPTWPLPEPVLTEAGGSAAPHQPSRAPTALAAGGRILWALVPDPRGARLERRDATTGRLRETVRVPPARALAATQRAAWLLEATGRLLRVGADGSARSTLRGVRAIASDGRRRLWALRADGRTLVRLSPSGRRILSVGRSAGPVSLVALTRLHLWLAQPGERRLERVRS